MQNCNDSIIRSQSTQPPDRGTFMKILVIEDEKDVRLNILEILASGGFDSLNADNGMTGIQLAKERSPDLILCDIKMPDFDGYNVLEALRQDPSTAMIPFIFLTAKADKADMRQGMNLGADDYLTKPFRRVELLETIAARLKRHSAQLEIQRKVDELQSINSQKNDLLNTITHDLRAPLTTIKVALQLMDAMPDNRRQYIDIALNACDQGDELIQNLLDLYQLESGEALAPPEPLNLRELLRKTTDAFQVRTRDCQQLLKVNLPETLPVIVADGVSLRRILVELLNNACKYTQSGGEICLKVREGLSENQTPLLQFTIANQSEIPTKNLPHIFDKFYRVPGSDRWQKGGTGLGLALVKKLVEQLQGSIIVKSQTGWTTFVIELPYETL
ncbi:response regulator [Leptolyngbya sp. FACHB-161]|jgi:two-component system sensor histidine kinase/response regulator|nr:response regulator [Leptolyngbya sp. FACHB-238]MBD2369213.1 response regulator [Leptolyngbya sp. FACHB-161]MBD2400014.1 response regulator [Leptolyngbya sp. FACHB-239]